MKQSIGAEKAYEDILLSVNIEATEDIVEYGKVLPGIDSSRNGNSMLLASAEGNTLASNDSVVFLGESGDVLY